MSKQLGLKKIREKGKFFWKKRWYSICSIHYEYNKECPMCNAGTWSNVWGTAISSFFCDHLYKLWFWWVN
jgi:hypothetical protein